MTDIDFLRRIHTNQPTTRGEASFFKFMKQNPHIVQRFMELREQMRQVRSRYRATRVVEAIRWDRDLKREDGRFKISNGQKAYLARLAMALDVVPNGFFQTKELTRSTREAYTLKAYSRQRHNLDQDD